MTRDEVVAALKNTRINPDAESFTQQAAMLHFRWAQLDPEAAMASAYGVEGSGRSIVIQSALTAWMASDPEAAFRHAEMVPAEVGTHRTMMARLLAGEGVATALEKAGRLGGDMRKRTIEALAEAACESEAQRKDFLDGLARWGSPEEQSEGRNLMIHQWARHDKQSALEILSDKPDDAKARTEIFRTWVRDDPAVALAWSAENPGIMSTADQAASYVRLTTRSLRQAELALPAVEKVPGLLETSVKQLHSACLREGWNAGGSDSYRLGLERAALRRHFARWSEVSPDDARAWRESLPPDLQANLDAAADDEDS